MKKLYIAAISIIVITSGAANAIEITANGGAVTQYIFRGIPQSDGKAAAQGGLDLAAGGLPRPVSTG